MIIPKSCPLCHTDQVQLCTDSNNSIKDYCRCRECKTTGPLALWNAERPYERKARMLAHELMGVLMDEALAGFDPICRSTVRGVRAELARLAAGTFKVVEERG